jgi:dihydrofolate reductase
MSQFRIAGYAIVSADGMLANAQGIMPDEIKNDADQQFFSDGLDAAAAVVHGRHSHEGQPNSPRRRRLVVTRRVAATAPDPNHPHALLWNPKGATLDEALQALGVTKGIVAVIGGTEVFGMFLENPGYDAFHLSRAGRARLPGGRPVFPQVPAQTPEEVLAAHGLKPGPTRVLDAAADVTLVSWTR